MGVPRSPTGPFWGPGYVESMESGQPERPANPDAADGAKGISRGLVVLLAVACGAAVANLYYAQPLLSTLGHAFGVSNGTAGLLVTVTQVGYVLGLAFLVPIGDLRERRSLISGTLIITAVVLAVAAVAPTFAVFAAALAAVGLTSVVAQIIVPMSSSLSAEHERGRVVGTVMSGLLIGILIARTVSGLLAAALGWRAVLVSSYTLRARQPAPEPSLARAGD